MGRWAARISSSNRRDRMDMPGLAGERTRRQPDGGTSRSSCLNSRVRYSGNEGIENFRSCTMLNRGCKPLCPSCVWLTLWCWLGSLQFLDPTTSKERKRRKREWRSLGER
ncbi:uncharacterized protein BO95DRAFT_10225 [Aspergillus brunneoviolaceus CBS 621.78]|uniref:Uncharacterized protein n=1 Tax=Aspergillus brunneoviolaceus CBS 621.78 TaxID=1450534 RepID=A0ACD1GR65_9EURO|nr:hypothetical protein BO95DRAFT_10225 [Aspergillus brunneoviolaceus CBS 621.78]RAH51619.1 hypothetical protein BO95DRAFT_10225 [Aspergillus brunneoviolaceus CBS 621.78]